ncbi:MAG: PD40 domain-containing protein [Phycisphaeraceae bacterium]|nr:PD40 domain-containing protein [Phycisphaeraceae bacterium]
MIAATMIAFCTSSATAAEEHEYLVAIVPGRVCAIALDGSVRTLLREPLGDRGYRVLLGGSHTHGLTITSTGDLLVLNADPERLERGILQRLRLALNSTALLSETQDVSIHSISGAVCGEPTVAPDDLHIALGSRGSSDYSMELHSLNIETGSLKRLTGIPGRDRGGPGGVAHRPRWSPDGTRIAFFWDATGLASDYMNRQEYELYVVTLTGELTKLAEACRRPGSANFIPWAGPIWSPDGKTVYFVGNYEKGHNEDGQGEPLTYSVPAVGGALQRVCRGNPTSITPDGRYLFVTGKPPTFGPESHRLRVDLRDGTEVSLGVDWSDALVSPSGRYVVGAPPGALVFFTIDGNEIARVDLSKTPLNRGVSLTQGAWWVKQK